MNFTYEQHFDSLTAYAAVRPAPSNASEYADTQRVERGEEWFGMSTADDVRAAIAQGWPDGVKRTFEALQALELRRATSIRRKRTRGAMGDELDMQRVYRGDLANAWALTAKRAVTGSSVVRVYVDVGARSVVRPGQLFWRGAAALVVIDALQAAGYAVEVIAGMTGKYENTTEHTMKHTVTVKESGAPLDLNALAACLCLIGFHRVFGFAGRLSESGETEVGSSFPWEMPDAISGLTLVYSKEQAQAWIDATLAPYAEG